MSKKFFRLMLVLSMLAVMTVNIAAAQETQTFRIWHFEQDSAMSRSWDYALEQFQELYPDVTIEFELKTFEGTVETARMVLNSNEVPDVMLINKGNATAGLYSRQGLLTDLTAVAEERGWVDVLSPSIQTTARYDENGIMGNGNLYGVPNYGEFVLVYYNRDLFEANDVSVPTSLEELEAVADTFVANGIVPFTLGTLEKWPPTHPWYEMVLYDADRELVSNFQFLQGEVDFHGEAFKNGTQRFADWIAKGYFNPNATGTTYDDQNAAFVQGLYPMNITGSWQYGAYINQITDFDWGMFLLPGKDLNTGSGGNMWVVPTTATNKEYAYDFIGLTLSAEAQTLMANEGGIPVAADLSQIEDEKILELNTLFSTIVENDAIAFYPDWPVPGYMDVLGAGLQEILGGTIDVDSFLDSIAEPYEDYKSSL